MHNQSETQPLKTTQDDCHCGPGYVCSAHLKIRTHVEPMLPPTIWLDLPTVAVG